MTAIFGGLFGLATVTSVVALLIQVVPVRDERALVADHLKDLSLPSKPNATAPTAPPKKQRTPVPGPWRISELAKDSSMLIVSDTMERRSFVVALGEKDVPKAQVYRILKAFEGVRKFDKSGRKDRFTVAMDRGTRKIRAFEYEVTPSEVFQAREDANGMLAGTQLDMKIAEEEVVASFYVGKDLAASYRYAGLEDGLLDVIDEALNGRVSTESFKEGGTVRLILTEETALGLFSKYKKVVALEYRPVDPEEKPVRAYWFTGQEAKGYFDDRGRQPHSGGWRLPVPGAPVTSHFNPKRLHPILKKPMPHTGTDFGAPSGTPIYAAYRGVVEFIGPAGPSGNLVTVKHPNGVTTGYAHMSKFLPGLKVGDKVGTHQQVGYVGTTGRSTGPHLHFTAKRDGKYFDALTLQMDGERPVPPVDKAAFLAAKEALDKRIDAIPLPEPPPEAPPPEPAKTGGGSEPPSDQPEGSPSAAEPTAEAAPNTPSPPPAGQDPAAGDPGDATDDDEGGEMIKGADLKTTPK
ncbi:M23 family metallopeptidase [Chondromyces crocatus]|nr:M23 family metallopeptidase [Chondromyces crocatus]